MSNTLRILWKISSKFKETEEPVWSEQESRNTKVLQDKVWSIIKNNTQSIIANKSSKKASTAEKVHMDWTAKIIKTLLAVFKVLVMHNT